MSKPDTIEDLKNDFEETERIMDEDKKKYLDHLKKQSADIDEFFHKEDSKTYFQKALIELENGNNKIVEPQISEPEDRVMQAPVIPKKKTSIKTLWENFKKIV